MSVGFVYGDLLNSCCALTFWTMEVKLERRATVFAMGLLPEVKRGLASKGLRKCNCDCDCEIEP